MISFKKLISRSIFNLADYEQFDHKIFLSFQANFCIKTVDCSDSQQQSCTKAICSKKRNKIWSNLLKAKLTLITTVQRNQITWTKGSSPYAINLIAELKKQFFEDVLSVNDFALKEVLVQHVQNILTNDVIWIENCTLRRLYVPQWKACYSTFIYGTFYQWAVYFQDKHSY